MSEFKGTPGKWAVDPLDLGALGDICTTDGEAIAQAQQRVPGPAGFDKERTANARLIAAAPDLLEALMAIRDLKNGTEMTYEDAYDSMFKSGGRDAWYALDAAIAKALQS